MEQSKNWQDQSKLGKARRGVQLLLVAYAVSIIASAAVAAWKGVLIP